MTKEGIKNILDSRPELREKLFARGFLFTDRRINTEEYPFYGLWTCTEVGKYNLLVSKGQRFYISESDKRTLVLIGHCYNPVRMISDEQDLLDGLCNVEGNNFFTEFNELTGVFTLINVKNDSVLIFGDASGMQTTFYTEKGVCYQ